MKRYGRLVISLFKSDGYGRVIDSTMSNTKRSYSNGTGETTTTHSENDFRKRPRLEETGRTVKAPSGTILQGKEEGSCPNGRVSSLTTKSLFVRGLGWSITSEQLAGIFSESYPIKHAFVVKDSSSAKSKGYGFVTFADANDAGQARHAFNGSLVAGQRISVEHADTRHRSLSGVEKHEQNSCSGNDMSSNNRRDRLLEGTEQPTKLIVRNLPWTVSNAEQLSSLFQSFGKIKEATMPKVKPGHSAGFGFVMLRGRKNAEKAMEVMNGKQIGGRALAVDWSIPKPTWQASQVSTSNLDRQKDLLTDSPPRPPSDASSSTSFVAEGLSNHSAESEYHTHEHKRRTSLGDDSLNDPLTLFVRNVPFTTVEEDLKVQFGVWGKVRYARIVYDPSSGRSKGSAFVRFRSPGDADECLKYAPVPCSTTGQHRALQALEGFRAPKESILQDPAVDTTGRYTIDGRILHVSAAVNSSEAIRLATIRRSFREQQDVEKRHLFLLSEGMVSPTNPICDQLSPSEAHLREDSRKQRQTLLKANPDLYLSLNRLSVRNLPRTVSSKDLKALARQAVVGFAEGVRAGQRQPISKEEAQRGGDMDKQAEKARRAKGKGVVKQAKVVFESKEGSKIDEKNQAGRSRGYGFIEYYTHRAALMGLRWLNGRAVEPNAQAFEDSSLSKKSTMREHRKHLIVEFAIENLQVVNRRQGREDQAQKGIKSNSMQSVKHCPEPSVLCCQVHHTKETTKQTSEDRRREMSNRQSIIGRKRMLRKSRRLRL